MNLAALKTRNKIISLKLNYPFQMAYFQHMELDRQSSLYPSQYNVAETFLIFQNFPSVLINLKLVMVATP